MMTALASHQSGPGWNPGVDAIMLVEGIFGSVPCSVKFFSVYFSFHLSLNTNTSKFQFDLECTDMFQ